VRRLILVVLTILTIAHFYSAEFGKKIYCFIETSLGYTCNKCRDFKSVTQIHIVIPLETFNWQPINIPEPNYVDMSQFKNSYCGTFLVPLLEYEHMSRGFTLNANNPHTGVDLVAPFNSPVLAANDGTIEFIGWLGDYGRLIDIRHKNGLVTRYAHLNSFAVGLKLQASVLRGHTIGYVGTSGHTTGPHLHFEIISHETPINPAPYLGLSACKNYN